MKDRFAYIEAKKKLDSIIKEAGLRKTPQRDMVMYAIFNMSIPLTVTEIYKAVKVIDKKISRCTVYNSVDFFVEHGILNEQPKVLTIKNIN